MHRPFSFGANWQSYLRQVDEPAFASARADIERWLAPGEIAGRRILDIGCGSGIHSLCMLAMGAAEVVSIDVDPESVAATDSLRVHSGNPPSWTVRHGSVLDVGFLAGLGRFDLVYAWGSLHHTGAMWTALGNAMERTSPGGLLWLALYTAGSCYPRDLALKQRYNRSGTVGRWILERREILREMRSRLRARQNPFAWNRRKARGMDVKHDILDWLGGLPYEVADPDGLVRWARSRGFILERIDPQPEGSCSVYLLSRTDSAGSASR